MSEHSGNQKIETSQQKILMVLRTRDIEFSTIDISAPGMQNQRTFMREKGRRKEGQRNVIPPQIFNGEEYRGDFDDFDVANEDDVLEEFLGIPRKRPKIEPVNTGRVAEEVGQIEVGKLELEEENVHQGDLSEEIEEVDWVEPEENYHTTEPYQNVDTSIEPPPTFEELSPEDIEENEILISIVEESSNDTADSLQENQGDLSEIEEVDWEEPEENFDTTEPYQNVDTSDEPPTTFEELSPKDIVENEILTGIEDENTSVIESSEDTADIVVNGDNVDDTVEDTISQIDSIDSDSDESDTDSDDSVMSDGEVMRKNTRGFKLLKNSKRFWKATLMMGHA